MCTQADPLISISNKTSLEDIQGTINAEEEYSSTSKLLRDVYQAALDDQLLFEADSYEGFCIKTNRSVPRGT